MGELKLYMLLLGCRPKGRLTEQHDIFFGIGRNLKELIPHINTFWREVKGNIHIDAWREVTQVNDHSITIIERPVASDIENSSKQKLFFLNLGGYKKEEFDEFHYKVLAVAENPAEAMLFAKQTSFYKHVGFKGAPSHVDDKYGVDIDDIFVVKDILPSIFKNKYTISIKKENKQPEDQMHLGYLPLKKIE